MKKENLIVLQDIDKNYCTKIGEMMSKLNFKIAGITFEADLDDASFILAEPFGEGVDLNGVNINISNESKEHPVMGYTTDIETMGLIFKFKTFRSSSLTNANLNDRMEKERVGVSKFAGSRFITCFCHTEQEFVPFWMYYGKEIRKNKVLLQFRNFALNFSECIKTDFALVKNNKKCFFQSEDYGKTINAPGGISTEEYDLRACVDSVSIFDVEYVPPNSEIFTEDNSGKSRIDFSKLTGQDTTVEMNGYDPTVLGKQKSNPWEYEKETRILSTLSVPDFSQWDYLDIRLNEEIFRGLKVILSPWDDGSLREKVEKIICESGLSEEIIDTIKVEDSALKGSLNFPE